MASPEQILFQGNTDVLSSFAHVNGYLIEGLRGLGYRVAVASTDARDPAPLPPERPDVYMFHGHPYDVRSAPGRCNVFLLNYEYFRLKKEDEVLVDRINHHFDVVVVASSFVRETLAPYLRVPIEVVPFGVDRSRFHPDVTPVELPAFGGFTFVYAGAVTERKGIDLLVRAYLREFSARDDVRLVIKEALRPAHLTPWIEGVLGSLGRGRDEPEVLHIHRDEDSLAGYFTAADAGVFPFRGEGFGLTILESIACGTPVIVTRGTGPMDFVREENATLVPARRSDRRGKAQLEPDVAALRRAMRRCYEAGRPQPAVRRQIARTVRHLSWENTLNGLHEVVQRRYRGSRSTASARRSGAFPVAYAYYRRGLTSWQKVSVHVEKALREAFADYTPVPFRAPLPGAPLGLLVGQSEYCCESFLRAAEDSPDVLRILHQEGTALEERVRIGNAERAKCGVPLVRKTPMEIWRNRTECNEADHILVPSRASARYFLADGRSAGKVKVIPWGIRTSRPVFPSPSDPLTFLFVGTDPFRKGIRLLFEAWDRLRLKDARLLCLTDRSVLSSQLLLTFLVRNPSITVTPLLPYRKFLAVYDQIHCQVLPSLEDSFSLVVADGMGAGKPAIVSQDTGIADLVTHGRDGWVVPTGSAEALAEALLHVHDHRSRLREMGEAARAAAGRYTWARFRREFTSWLRELAGGAG